ncbi:MAG: hypothetical protein KF734_18050 [Saprospiraceae bacterium]|nr:hypothetical protein [Saprospiraceae bacterium]
MQINQGNPCLAKWQVQILFNLGINPKVREIARRYRIKPALSRFFIISIILACEKPVRKMLAHPKNSIC